MSIAIANWRQAAALDPWFHQCLDVAIGERELVENFDRLYGTNVCMRAAAPIDLAVDEASGRRDADFERFCEFVFDFVYARLPHPIGEWAP